MYNGIKLTNPGGSAFDCYQRKQIEEIVLDDSFGVAPWDEIKNGNIYNGAIGGHIDGILLKFPPLFFSHREVKYCISFNANGHTPLIASYDDNSCFRFHPLRRHQYRERIDIPFWQRLD